MEVAMYVTVAVMEASNTIESFIILITLESKSASTHTHILKKSFYDENSMVSRDICDRDSRLSSRLVPHTMRMDTNNYE